MSEFSAQWIGSLGVAILLMAFFLNLIGRLGRESRWYQALNAAGAALAGYASYIIGFIPFVVLEATWTIVALAALFRKKGIATDFTDSTD